jgi:hypothetical protein
MNLVGDLGFLAERVEILFENQILNSGTCYRAYGKGKETLYPVPGPMMPIHVMSDVSSLIYGAFHSFRLGEF